MSRSSAPCAAPLSTDRAARATPSREVRRRAGDDEGGGGVENRRRPGRRSLAPSSTARSSPALCSGSPPLRSSGLARRDADFLAASMVKRRIAPSSSATTWVGPVVVISSSPSEPCTVQTRSEPSSLQHLRQRFEPDLREHAEELARHAGRVRERPEQVEQRARAELDAHRRDVAHRGVVRLREHEAQPRLGEAALEPRRIETDLHAERGQHVGRAGARGGGAVAVLGDRHAAAGDDDRGERRDVVASPNGRRRCRRCRWRPAGARHPGHAPAHRRDRADDLVERLAAHAQRHQEGAALRRRDLAREQVVEGGAGLLARQRGAGGDLGEIGLEAFHGGFNARADGVVTRAVPGARRGRRSCA